MAFAEPIIKAMSRVNTWAYRVTNGRIGGKFMRGAPVLLLTTVGRKSGEKRVAPLIYARDGERVLVVASKGGMDHHPLWYRNLVAHPEVEVQIGADVRPMTAHTASASREGAALAEGRGGVPRLRRLPGAHDPRHSGRRPDAALKPEPPRTPSQSRGP